MVKPLRSEGSTTPESVQFAHFGVLNDGAQSKTSTMTSITVNVLLALVIVIISAATKKTIDNRIRLTELTAPIPVQKPEPPKPKIIPPKPPKLPELPKVELHEAPKIKVELRVPDVPKPLEVKMEAPKPVIAPAAPQKVIAMAAPKVVNLAHPTPPALVNNSAHPSAVALGRQDNPIAPSNAPAVAAVNLGNRGVAGMPSSNTGLGKPTAVNLAGNGTPGGANKGIAVVAVAGIPHGVPGATGALNATGRIAGPVNLGQVQQTQMAKPVEAKSIVAQASPRVLYKPKPEYTPEAVQMHLEGVVSVRIRVLASGAVQVVGIDSGLGHGLDESARRAILATKFQPAVDASGHAIDWDGVVKVAFQLAG